MLHPGARRFPPFGYMNINGTAKLFVMLERPTDYYAAVLHILNVIGEAVEQLFTLVTYSRLLLVFAFILYSKSEVIDAAFEVAYSRPFATAGIAVAVAAVFTFIPNPLPPVVAVPISFIIPFIIYALVFYPAVAHILTARTPQTTDSNDSAATDYNNALIEPSDMFVAKLAAQSSEEVGEAISTATPKSKDAGAAFAAPFLPPLTTHIDTAAPSAEKTYRVAAQIGSFLLHLSRVAEPVDPLSALFDDGSPFQEILAKTVGPLGLTAAEIAVLQNDAVDACIKAAVAKDEATDALEEAEYLKESASDLVAEYAERISEVAVLLNSRHEMLHASRKAPAAAEIAVYMEESTARNYETAAEKKEAAANLCELAATKIEVAAIGEFSKYMKMGLQFFNHRRANIMRLRKEASYFREDAATLKDETLAARDEAEDARKRAAAVRRGETPGVAENPSETRGDVDRKDDGADADAETHLD
ncbi:hypothetical protein HDU96_004910 [Phlyctochytrium bullatum]|nr:hypothetical protein HDU96_004910 [Phlyctochytrium bullatum]